MDSSPLNLAHFHERRADKFLRHLRFDDAFKAVEMSLLYLQDAYKNVRIKKSIEVLDTQKWDLERKLRQIQMRKQQHERSKLKEIVPNAKETVSILTLRPENSVTAQSVAKSIDKTIREFDAKYIVTHDAACFRQDQLSKENQDPKNKVTTDYDNRTRIAKRQTEIGRGSSSTPTVGTSSDTESFARTSTGANDDDDCEDLPALAPLELPAFDFDVFTTAAPTLSTITGLAESFQK